ncbi:pilus assembly PilX family protein, partial [Acinetobacter baumannii]
MIRKQHGATLIVVLIILIMVTLLGTLAIKSGILGLKIATN